MHFDGTFEIEDATIDEVWTALSDPVMVRDALPGCEFVVEVDDEDPDFDELRDRVAEEERPEPTTDPAVMEERAIREGGIYAALMEVGVGSVNPTFETVITVIEREPYRMNAEGEGSASGSSFEVEAGMELSETDGGVAVEWWADAEVFGKIAQMGQRVINPVTNRMVKQFFGNVQDQIEALHREEAGEEATASTGQSKGIFGRILARIKRLIGMES